MRRFGMVSRQTLPWDYFMLARYQPRIKHTYHSDVAARCTSSTEKESEKRVFFGLNRQGNLRLVRNLFYRMGLVRTEGGGYPYADPLLICLQRE
jgi:hypothetical protein